MKKISPKPSIIVRLNIALASIMILGISTMLVSYWLSEHAEQDPLAINIASSLRMQTYRIGLMAMDKEVSTEAWQAVNQKINRSWISPVFICSWPISCSVVKVNILMRIPHLAA